MNSRTPYQPAILEVAEEPRPALLVLLGSFSYAEDLAEAICSHADRHEDRNVSDFPAPAPLQVDPVEIDVGVLLVDRPTPPGFDSPVDLLVQLADRARAHTRTPQRLGDVLDAANRDAGEVHLDQRLLDG